MGPCKGGVVGPPLAAGRRDHHVPLGASQSRFLPFLSALSPYLEGSVVATECASFMHVCIKTPTFNPFDPIFNDHGPV